MNMNIEVFKDTRMQIQTNQILIQKTQHAVQNTTLYEEGFVSAKKPFYQHNHVAFQETLSLIPARALAGQGKHVAVLNFANPVEPGGGVLRGANAQEEYLCRASNLYDCLISQQAKPWYDKHQAMMQQNNFFKSFLGTDSIIYSKDVTVIKEDVGYQPDSTAASSQENTDEWVQVDIITCAAPFFPGPYDILPDDELEHIFTKRIRNIFEVAIENDVQSLILGAFGCGAFHNPPMVVAKAFKKLLLQDRYLHAFSDTVFAVKRTYTFCENIEAFQLAFSQFPSDGRSSYS